VKPSILARIEKIIAQRRIPRATYRLQFQKGFTFRQALDLVSYFDELGISDLYASPLFKPCEEDSHGYDVCDHKEFNPAIGSQEDFDALAGALQERSMGLILDVVPNHMGIGTNNHWWMDVLENGPSSTFACYFDIDMQPAKPELENKVLLPILEDQYGKVLESGKFRMVFEGGGFFICYYEHKMPLAPRTYSQILSYRIEPLTAKLGKENEHLQELQSIMTALSYLPSQTELTPEKIEERIREKEVIKRRLTALYQNSPEIKGAIDETLRVFNGNVDNPRSFDLLDELLGAQAYRPAFWRVASDEINYRRFFDINSLAAVRMELPQVFQEAHEMIFRLLTAKKLTGLRIDHPDGLWNPIRYFHMLQKIYLLHALRAQMTCGAEPEASHLEEAAAAWLAEQLAKKEKPSWPLYVVAEKILCEGESLPEDWAVFGMTGYEYLNQVNGLFVDSGKAKIFDRIYSHFIGTTITFRNLVNSTKKMIMLVSLASEVQSLSHQLERISEKNRWYRDFTLNSLTFAIREVIACLPVYRTYITGPEDIPQNDQAYVEAAVEEAKRRNPRTAEEIFDFIRDTLLLHNIHDFAEVDRPKLVQFVMKFQQITGPVMAKGVEDTAFYVYNRLVSLNEVGGHPDHFGLSVLDFHRQNQDRQQKWPHSLLATSTHDTKRSEDVRARIDVLSEISGEWRAALGRWSRVNGGKKRMVDGQPAPDRNDEYLLYQSLIGAWPFTPMNREEFQVFRERMVAYMRKATLEAKVHTSWINPNEEYDEAVAKFVEQVLDDKKRNRFLDDLANFQRRVAYFGRFNSLSQVLLKLTSPGVPDLYQGTELWDFSLVDPDNRRPVDYNQRQTFLQDLKTFVEKNPRDLVPLARKLLDQSQDGRIKLYLICRTLHLRRGHPRLFGEGAYLPLEPQGEKGEHVCAFARTLDQEGIIVIVPRLVVGLTGGKEEPPMGEEIWKDTWLALPQAWTGRTFRNLFTGEECSPKKKGKDAGISLSRIFRNFPVALLVREE
jgi:(1->4)-alpha-D-glucan 1-alpha-D-glucosylmutase